MVADATADTRTAREVVPLLWPLAEAVDEVRARCWGDLAEGGF